MSTSTELLTAALGRSAGLAAVLLLAGCATTPEVDPMQQRVEALDASVARIDRTVSTQSLQMSQRIDAQQQELRTLRGRIEELQNENAMLQKQQRDLYADLDKRLNGVAAGTAAGTVAGTAAGAGAAAATAGAADEQTLYARALEQLRARDYGAAVESFRSLAATYPNGQMADNTQYWLGETYYVTSEYDHAAAAFQKVLTGWPNSRKAPDALLKLGYTQIEQNKLAQARTTLLQVVTKYPDSEAAKLASDRIAKLPR